MIGFLNDLKISDSCKYSVGINTNQEARKILVEQDQYELRFFLLERDDKKEIDKRCICGLPKKTSLPMEFFLSSRVKILGDGERIEFLGKLLGGMDQKEDPNPSKEQAPAYKKTIAASGSRSPSGEIQGSITIKKSISGQPKRKKCSSSQKPKGQNT